MHTVFIRPFGAETNPRRAIFQINLRNPTPCLVHPNDSWRVRRPKWGVFSRSLQPRSNNTRDCRRTRPDTGFAVFVSKSPPSLSSSPIDGPAKNSSGRVTDSFDANPTSLARKSRNVRRRYFKTDSSNVILCPDFRLIETPPQGRSKTSRFGGKNIDMVYNCTASKRKTVLLFFILKRKKNSLSIYIYIVYK